MYQNEGKCATKRHPVSVLSRIGPLVCWLRKLGAGCNHLEEL